MDSKYTLRSTAAVAALAFLAACQDSPTPTASAPDLQRADARSEQAQARLAALFPDASADVLDLPGTVYADHNEGTGKLEFGIERAEQARGVEARLRARGVRDGEYEIRVTPAITNMATLRDENLGNPNAGTQINFGGYVCTMGFNINGGTGFITNSHCTNKQGGVENTDYWLPVRVGTAAAEAREVQDPTFVKQTGCSGGKTCRRSDASRAVYLNGMTGNFGYISAPATINTRDLTVAGTLRITGTDLSTSFALGSSLEKIGRTTGHTRGTVSNTCVTVNVSGSRFQLICQTLVSNNSAAIVEGGDSGSPVFRNNGNGTVTLVGILWGGSGSNLFVFSPLANVLGEITGASSVH